MSKNQFTGTATQPQRNRKLCQFNKDQYFISGSKLFAKVIFLKLKYFPVPVRFQCGSGKLKCCRYFTTFYDI